MPGVQTDDQGLGLPLMMGRVGLAAAASTFTLGWDETEFGRFTWWVVEMEDVMKGDKGRLIWCPYLVSLSTRTCDNGGGGA